MPGLFSFSSNSKDVMRVLKNFAKQVPEEAQKEIEAILGRVKDEMQVEGDTVTYPIQWDSEKQRRFVMAKLRRENNLPYQRTGDYIQSFTIETLPNGGTLKGAKQSPYISGDVDGKRQSNIHKGRWKTLRVAITNALKGTPQNIIGRLQTLFRKLTGQP